MNKDLRFAGFFLGYFFGLIGNSVIGFRVLNFLTKRLAGMNIKGLSCEELWIEGPESGQRIRTRIYRPDGGSISGEKLPAMLYLHGGGYVLGVPEIAGARIKKFIKAKACVVIAPDYRKAFEAPYPAALQDAYQTLLWIKDNAEELGVHPNKIIVGGHSAGGGLTASVCLYARDKGEVDVSFQMPIYPMIDDRQNLPSAVNNTAPLWNSKSNRIAWNLYLAEIKKENKEVPAYAAPSRAADYSNLPPAITFVGDIEPFYDETAAFVESLKKAGVATQFKVFEGCFHGFETIVPNATVSKEADEFLYKSYTKAVEEHYP
jgi:acetyl esterase/lipase